MKNISSILISLIISLTCLFAQSGSVDYGNNPLAGHNPLVYL